MYIVKNRVIILENISTLYILYFSLIICKLLEKVINK